MGQKANIRFFSGKTGTGKSFLAGCYVETLLESGKYVVVFDPHNEHRFGQVYPFVKFVVGEKVLSLLSKRKAYEIIKHYMKQGKNLRIVTNKLYRQQYMELISYFSWAILNIGNITFFIDEAKNVAPNDVGAPIELKQLVTEGRKFNIDVIIVSQRPQQIDTEIISQANKYYIFQMTDKNDIARISGYVNDPDEILNLKNREYIFCDTDLNIEKRCTTEKLCRKTKHKG